MWSGVRAAMGPAPEKKIAPDGRARRPSAVCARFPSGTTPAGWGPAKYAGRMNPRYRRLVIPCALGGLILIAVVAALVK